MSDFMKKIVGLKGLASIGFSDVIGNGVTAIFWFSIAALIDPSTYGNLFYFIGIANIGSSISLIGTQNSLVVYIAKNVKVYSTLYFLSLVFGIISSVAIIIIFYRIDIAFLVISYVIFTLGFSDLLGRKLYFNYAKYSLLQKSLLLVVGLSFFYLFGVEGTLYALVISYLPYVIRVLPVLMNHKLDFSLFKSRFGFIWNNYVMSLVLVFWAQIDKLIIPSMLGFAILGNYSLASQIISMLMILPSAIFKYILPQDASGIKNKKLKQYSIIFSLLSTLFGITIVPIFIPLVFPEYIIVDEIRIMSFAIIPATINILYKSKLLALEKSKLVLVGTIISLITLASGMIVFGSLFGFIGVALSFVLAQVMQTIFLVYFNKFYIYKR